MIAAAERVAAIIESGGVLSSGGAFADRGVTIIENFAPYVFEGSGSVERWSRHMRAHLIGVAALRHAFGPAQDFSRIGDEVYFSLPTNWRGLKGGAPFVEDGGWAFELTGQGGRWRVRGYGWPSPAQRRCSRGRPAEARRNVSQGACGSANWSRATRRCFSATAQIRRWRASSHGAPRRPTRRAASSSAMRPA